jgi:cAMP-dependent protein kinase regulator
MNKEKLSHKEEAQRAFARGEWKKALESFQRHCEEEPEDLRSRLKVGELLERLGRKKEGVEVYREVGEAYARDGFILQAISVNKIILRINPSLQDISDRLAQLCREKEREERIPQALAKIPLFSELSPQELQSLLRYIKATGFPKDAFVCREGEKGDSLCILCRGEIAISKELGKGKEMTIRHLREGDIFGELGFFTDGKRHATLRATTECEILEIPREGLDGVIQTYPRVREALQNLFRERILDTFLALSPLFSSLRPEERGEVLKRFVLREIPEGTILFRRGDRPTCLYMVKNGEVEISVRNRQGRKVVLEIQKSGNFFGEISLLVDKPRMTDAKTIRPSELLELTKSDFHACLQRFPGLHSTVKEMTSMRLARMKATLSQEGIERAKEAMV